MRISISISTCALCLASLLVTTTARAQDEEAPVPQVLRAYDVGDIVTPTADVSLTRLAPRGALVIANIAPSEPGNISLKKKSDYASNPYTSLFCDEIVGPLGVATAGPEVSLGGEDYTRSTHELAEHVEELVQRGVAHQIGAEDEDYVDAYYRAGKLFVRTTAEGHAAVPQLLKPLRAVASRRLGVECIIAPTAALDAVDPDWRTKPSALAQDVFDRVLIHRSARLLSAAARVGKPTVTRGNRFRSLLSDYEVNQTGVIPVINPVIAKSPGGEQLHIRPLEIPGSDAIFLDVAIGRSRINASADQVASTWGGVDLPIVGEMLFSTSLVARAGSTYVVGDVSGVTTAERDLEGAVVLLRLRAEGAQAGGAAKPSRQAEFLQHYDLSLLERRWWIPRPSWRVRRHDSDLEVAEEFLYEIAGGEEVFHSDDPSWFEVYGPRRMLFLDTRREGHAEVAKYLAAEVRRLTRVVRVDLELVNCGRQAFTAIRSRMSDGVHLADGWRELVDADVRHFSLTGVVGETHALRLANLHTLVVDIEAVSGGTGFAIVERHDPVTQTCGDGLEFRIQVDLGEGDRPARLHLYGAEAKLSESRKVRSRTPTIGEVTSEGEAQGLPAGAHSTTEFHLTLPSQDVLYWDVERDIRLDADVVLHSDARAGRDAQLLIARVREVR